MTSRQRRGAEVFGEQLADGLAERGWYVDFAALTDTDGPAIQADALVPRAKDTLGRLDRDVLAAIRARIEQSRPDVIFANGSATLQYGVAARGLRAKPRLVYGSIGEPSWWSRSKAARIRTGVLLRRANAVTSVSVATARQLIDDFGVPAKKVAIAPIGIPAHFGEIDPEPAAGVLRVLFLGSLSPEKGPDVALRAAAAAAKRAALQLRIVGGGPMLERLEHVVSELDDPGMVELAGPVDDVRPHLAWADVLVLSSQTEGLPGVVLEAGAAGVPAVAFDVGGVSDIVEPGATGWLVARGDEDALAAALVDAATQRDAVGARGATLMPGPRGEPEVGRSPRGPGMRVAHLTTVDMSLRLLVFPQLKAVIEAGGECYGISAAGPWVEELEAAGIRHLALDSSTRGMDVFADLRAARELYRHLKAHPVDILHTHNPKPGIYGRLVGKLAGVPIIVNTVHGLYATEDDRWPKRLVVYLLEALAARFSDAELAQNIEDVELMTRYRITVPDKMRLLGNGVDLARFDPDRVGDEPRRRLRAEWDVADDQVVVGIVGRLVAEKGYPELFDAMERLDPKRYVLVVAGPDDPTKADALPREIVERAQARGVRMLGMRDDVDELYSAFDLFVLPSHREGFPRAAMEAAAMGLPIVATDIRGCRQVVTDGYNGFLVPAKDAGALASAIAKLGDDAERRAEMSHASYRRSREEFDERRVVDIVMNTYRRVAREKGLSAIVPADPAAEISIRRAEVRDATAVARLHTEIATGFLSTLGARFLARLYRGLIGWPEAHVWVADRDGEVIGYVASVESAARFYRHFARRHGLQAGLSVVPRLVRPSVIKRLWETLRHVSGEGAEYAEAELLSIAISSDARGQGLGRRLLTQAVAGYRARGLDRVQVVIAADNEASLAAHRSQGFEEVGTIEVHAGEPSKVLVWKA